MWHADRIETKSEMLTDQHDNWKMTVIGEN